MHSTNQSDGVMILFIKYVLYVIRRYASMRIVFDFYKHKSPIFMYSHKIYGFKTSTTDLPIVRMIIKLYSIPLIREYYFLKSLYIFHALKLTSPK